MPAGLHTLLRNVKSKLALSQLILPCTNRDFLPRSEVPGSSVLTFFNKLFIRKLSALSVIVTCLKESKLHIMTRPKTCFPLNSQFVRVFEPTDVLFLRPSGMGMGTHIGVEEENSMQSMFTLYSSPPNTLGNCCFTNFIENSDTVSTLFYHSKCSLTELFSPFVKSST